MNREVSKIERVKQMHINVPFLMWKQANLKFTEDETNQSDVVRYLLDLYIKGKIKYKKGA